MTWCLRQNRSEELHEGPVFHTGTKGDDDDDDDDK